MLKLCVERLPYLAAWRTLSAPAPPKAAAGRKSTGGYRPSPRTDGSAAHPKPAAAERRARPSSNWPAAIVSEKARFEADRRALPMIIALLAVTALLLLFIASQTRPKGRLLVRAGFYGCLERYWEFIFSY